ncbi:MAG: M20/M25/M40 family metallo-hydrolase [Planctomycetota bacterium]|nr:M20/M25/M40 family metallo-hydrolase [Planctomycetota bacterium]
MKTATKERGLSRLASIAIAAFGLAGFAAYRASVPPDPRPMDADPSSFSAARARATLTRILGDEAPHPVGSANHAAVMARLLGELRAIGVEPTVQDALVAGRNGVVTRVRNVVATVPGRLGGPAIALATHHDSVAAGPGASDAGAGVAAAIECVRALCAGAPLEHTLVLLITDGEEVDLSGASAFVREHPLARDVRAVVNLEARGTEGLAYLFQTGPGVGDALARFASLAERQATTSIAALVYERLPNDTDLSVFLDAGWTGLNFAFIGGFRRYHTPRDDLAHLDPRSLQHLGDGALAGLRALDGLDLSVPHAERSERVWHDVLGRFVIHWPRGWSVPLAVLSLTVLVGALARRRRDPAVSGIAEAAWGATAAALGILLAALFTFGFARAQDPWHGAPDPWFAAPEPWSVACLVLALLGASLGCALPKARRARREHVFLGTWILCAAVGVVVALVEPAACLLFVAPALVASAAAWCLGANPGRTRIALVALAPFLALAAIWLPFLDGVEQALGFAAGFVPGALAGTVAAALTPLLLDRPLRTAAWLAVAGLVAFGVLARLPDRTPDLPIGTNTVHVQSETDSYWSVAASGADLPAALRHSEGWDAQLLPWSRWLPTARVVYAERHLEPAPRMVVTVLEESDIHRRLRLKITSPRGASTFVLGFPSDGYEILAIRSGGLEVSRPPRSGTVLHFVGIGPEGVEIDIAQPDRRPWSVHLADVRAGRPDGLEPPFAPEATRVPRGRGDVSIVATEFDL